MGCGFSKQARSDQGMPGYPSTRSIYLEAPVEKPQHASIDRLAASVNSLSLEKDEKLSKDEPLVTKEYSVNKALAVRKAPVPSKKPIVKKEAVARSTPVNEPGVKIDAFAGKEPTIRNGPVLLSTAAQAKPPPLSPTSQLQHVPVAAAQRVVTRSALPGARKPPACYGCNRPSTCLITQSDRDKNAGRPYYVCLECPYVDGERLFQSFADDVGVGPNNPSCFCNKPSRLSRIGPKKPHKEGNGFWSCATKDCEYYSEDMRGQDRTQMEPRWVSFRYDDVIGHM